MNLIELNRSLRQLRLGGMAAVLETRLQQAQAEPMAPIDLLSCLVSDELTRRGDRLLERRRKQAQFRDPQVTFDNFDFDFNKKMNRSLVFDLATAAFVGRREDALFLGPPGTGKSHLAQAIGKAVIDQGYRVLYREAHILLEEIAEAALDGKRKEHMEQLSTVALLIIDDLGMRKLGPTAAEELLEIVMRRYGRVSTLVTSNRPVYAWDHISRLSGALGKGGSYNWVGLPALALMGVAEYWILKLFPRGTFAIGQGERRHQFFIYVRRTVIFGTLLSVLVRVLWVWFTKHP